jgi:hypothetical protein
MTKPSKKNAKKLQKKLNGNNNPKDDTVKKKQEKKTEQIIDNNDHFELFFKFSQPEHIDITKILTETPNKPEETETLEKTAAQFVPEEENENLIQTQYTAGVEDYTKYNKHADVDVTKYPAKDKQLKQYKTELLSFNPVTTDDENNSPESDYTKKSKEQNY